MIFLDAGPLIAFLSRRDNHHEAVLETFKELFQSGRRLLTTNRVVSEVYDAIRYDRRTSRKNDARPALAVFDAVIAAGESIETAFIDQEIERRAVSVLRAYPDQNFSFCDACSFALIEERRLGEIYTFDQRDFRIYKFRRSVEFL
jgi:predicted nucleic acid-binding protein